MDWSTLPLWIYLAGIPVALGVGGRVIGRKASRENFDNEDIAGAIAVTAICSALWPIGAPIYFTFGPARKAADAERQSAHTLAELDKTAADEGLTKTVVPLPIRTGPVYPPRAHLDFNHAWTDRDD